jgi:putative endonuclease
MLASQRNGTLYHGVTSDLVKRTWQHQNDVVEGFTSRYQVHTLVWYELHPTMESAILREKALKKWKRVWKMRLIEGRNSALNDLYPAVLQLGSCLRRNDEPTNQCVLIQRKTHATA